MQIINVKGLDPKTQDIVYCGRDWAGWKDSPLGNPIRKGFKCKICKEIHKTPSETIPCYKFWLVNNIVQENPIILKAMNELNKDSVLGCWCFPNPCHCQIIIETWEKFFNV